MKVQLARQTPTQAPGWAAYWHSVLEPPHWRFACHLAAFSCGQCSLVDLDWKDWEKPIRGSNLGLILPWCDAEDGWWAGALGVSPPWYVVPSWHIKAVVQMQSSKEGRCSFFCSSAGEMLGTEAYWRMPQLHCGSGGWNWRFRPVQSSP